MSVFYRKACDFYALQVPCPDPGFLRETQRVVAANKRRTAALRIGIVARHGHAHGVHADRIASGNDYTGRHPFKSLKPRSFPSSHSLYAIHDGEINWPDTVLINKDAGNPIARISRRIRMQLSIYSRGRRRSPVVQHSPALLRWPLEADDSAVAAFLCF